MTKKDMFKIGCALNNIACLVCDATLKKIEPYLKEIENIVLDDADNGKENENAVKEN